MNQRNHWRAWAQLDLAEITNWPTTPRRLLFLVVSLIAFALIATWSLIPQWQDLQAKRAKTAQLQQQYQQVAHLNAQKERASNDPTTQAQPTSVLNTAQWYTELINSAMAQNLKQVSLNPVPPKDSASTNQSQTPTDQITADKNVGELTIEFEGNYADVLSWAHQTAQRPETISLEDIAISGTSNQTVKAKMRLFFIKEADK